MKKVKPKGLTFLSVHGVRVEREEKFDARFEQRVLVQFRVGGEKLLGSGLCFMQEG